MRAGEPWIEHSICRLRVTDKEPRIQLWATQQQFHNSMMCWIFDPTVIKLASLPFVNVSRCNQETDGKAQAWTACPYYLLKTLVKKSGQQKGKPWENNTNCSTALLPKMTWTHSNICLKFSKGRIIVIDLLVFIPYTSQLKKRPASHVAKRASHILSRRQASWGHPVSVEFPHSSSCYPWRHIWDANHKNLFRKNAIIKLGGGPPIGLSVMKVW